MKQTIIILLSLVIFSCKKSDNGLSSSFWDVKYEITSSNKATKVAAVYRDNTGNVGNVGSLSDTTSYKIVPWNYEAHYSKDPGLITTRALQIIVSGASPYNSSDVITAKIFVDSKVVIQSSNPGSVGILISYNLQ